VTLDAIGNISWKLGVGNYAYHATQKRAVVAAGSFSFGYDANGNMTSRNGSNIGYTSYNLPNVINAPGGYSSTLSYGAFRNRFKQVAIGPSGTETTIYVAGLLEKVSNGSGTHYRHLIQGGNGTAAIHSRTVGGGNATFYLHRDHLGSPELITDSSGNVLVRPSFAAYGERRDGSDWDGAIGSGDLNTLAGISRRGFTGHEHLDAVNLIHMNGRVFEPVAGRFLSADPLARTAWTSPAGQYAYALNNPLRYIDPTGFCDVDPVTGTLINCDLGPVDVEGEPWDECDWGGPWMAGWSPQCLDAPGDFWEPDPFWDHDPFADFDNQPEEAGGGGGGGDGQQTQEESEAERPKRDGPVLTCTIGPMRAAMESKIGLFGEAKIRTPLGGIHMVLDFASANQSTDFQDYLSQGFKVSFQVLGKWEFGLGYERTAPLGSTGGPNWNSGTPLLGWRNLELSKEGLEFSVGGGMIFGASAVASTGPATCAHSRRCVCAETADT